MRVCIYRKISFQNQWFGVSHYWSIFELAAQAKAVAVETLIYLSIQLSWINPSQEQQITTFNLDVINEKVKKAVTDTIKEIRYDPVNRPGLYIL